MISWLLEFIPFILSWLIAKVTPYKWTDPHFSNIVQDVKRTIQTPEKLVDKIKKTLKSQGFPISKLDQRSILCQNKGGLYFDDFEIFFFEGNPFRLRATGEGGERYYKRFWRSRWLVGHYPALYSWGRGTFPKGTGLKYLRMNYSLDFFNKETGRIRKAKDCHMHSGNLRSEEVNKFSMGCIGVKHKDAWQMVTDAKAHIEEFDQTVMLLEHCDWVHEVPYLKVRP